MTPLDTIHYKGCTIDIHQDDDPGNPRTEWDNVGIMLCKHRDYILGDRKRGDPEPTADEIIAITEDPNNLWLPLYLLDHSGISIRAGSPSSNWTSSKNRFTGDEQGWDTSTVGIIYCTKKKAVEEWGKKLFTKTVAHKAYTYLQGEVDNYDSYLTGSVVGFIANDPDGEQIDSCWGFYPDTKLPYSKQNDYMIGEAKASIDYWLKNRAERTSDYAQLGEVAS